MKRIYFVIALFLSLGIVGCDDEEDEKDETPKGRYFDCETDRPIYKTLENEPVTIKYSEVYKVFVIMFNEPGYTALTPLVPCSNSLPKKYQIEGLKVKVSGECRNCTSQGAPNIRIIPLFKIRITSIKK